MHKIRDWLYIGKYRETTSRPLLDSYNIGAMLHLAEDVRHDGIETLYLGIDDGVPVRHEILKQGLDFLIEQKAQGKVLLSACGAGVSRSTTFAIGVLMHEEDLGIWEAYQAILDHHPDAFPAFPLVVSLGDYFQTPITPIEAAEKTMGMSLARQRK
jgi:hypothetical protein